MTIISLHAKWIGAGEHAILRQGGGIVFPCFQRQLSIQHLHSDASLQVAVVGKTSGPLRLMLLGLIEEGLHMLGQTSLTGQLRVEHNIIPGMGLGFSAILCVAVARLLQAQSWLKETEVFTFAHQLEHQFHGQSSGLDVIGVMHDVPVYYEPGPVMEVLPWNHLPACTLSPITREASATVNCIESVLNQYQKHPEKRRWDYVMAEAVCKMRHALKGEHRLSEFIESVEEALSCFEAWGLITPAMQRGINELRDLGALAVKPTGAGNGGYLLSVWPEIPHAILQQDCNMILAYDQNPD